MTDALKIVVTYKENKATVGISKPECDPRLTLEEGTLEEISARIPHLVELAEVIWEDNPKYPKCETDLAPPAPARTAASAPKAPKAKENATKPRLF